MRTDSDAVRSLHKYIAKCLASFEPDADWEVRFWDEEGTYKPPFARVAAVGSSLTDGDSTYADVTQPMTVHLYPQHDDPDETTEQAVLRAAEVKNAMFNALMVGVKWTEPLSPPRALTGYLDSGGSFSAGSVAYQVSSVGWDDGESLPSAAGAVTVADGDQVTLQWESVPQAASYRIYRASNLATPIFTLIGTALVAEYADSGLDPATPGPQPLTTPTSFVTARGLPQRIPLYDFEGVDLDGADSDSTLRHPSDYLRIVLGSLTMNELPDPTDDRLRAIIAEMRVTWRRPLRIVTGKPVQSVVTAFDTAS